MSLSRRHLFNIMDEYQSKKFADKCNYLKNRVIEMTKSDKWSNQIKQILSRFTIELKTKWESCQRKRGRFLSIHNAW